MKKVTLLFMVLFIALWVGNGCRKDDSNFSLYEDVYFRKDNINFITKSGHKVYRRTTQNDEFIQQTIEKVYNYYNEHNIDSIKQMLELRFGYPLWALTKKVSLANNLYQTITPVFNPNHQLITNFVYTYSYNDDVAMMSVKNTLKGEFLTLQQTFQNELDGIFTDIFFRGTGEGGMGQNGGTGPTWDCTESIELEYTATITQGYLNYWDIPINTTYIVGNTLNIQETVHHTGLIVNQFLINTYQECEGHDPDNDNFEVSNPNFVGGGTSNWKGIGNFSDCKKYFNVPDKNFGESEAKRERVLSICGCEKAFKLSDERIDWFLEELEKGLNNGNSNDRFVACYMCSNYNGLLINKLDHIKVICEEFDINSLIRDIVGESCNKKITWKDINDKLNGKDWIYSDPNATLSFNMSNTMNSMLDFFDISKYQGYQLSQEELCDKMNLYKCIKPDFEGKEEGTDEYEKEKAKKEVFDIVSNGKITDPCNGNNIDISSYLEEMCEQENITLSSLIQKFDGIESLIEDPSFLNCKALNCIYKHIKDSGISTFCNNIYKFHYSDKINLTLKVGTTYGHADGQVTLDANGAGVIMTFANYNCNDQDHIGLAETILHESFHAMFRYKLAQNNTSEQEYRNLFRIWVNDKYSVQYTEHHLMIKYYMEQIASELAIIDGNKFDKSYYMAWVWDGLKQYWEDFVPQSLAQEWETKRLIVQNSSPFKCI